MTLKDFLISICVVTLFSWIAWFTVLFYIDPEASRIGIFVFYAALFFSLLGTFTMLGLGIRMGLKRLHHEKVVAFRFISPSIRQAVWFSIVIVMSLVLLASDLFTWWSVLLLLGGLVVLESFYLMKNPDPRKRAQPRNAPTKEL
ncbi:MAG: hypothetical protein Q8P90_02345 [bacterium]|nr:hypothetical protein [bacterium]